MLRCREPLLRRLPGLQQRTQHGMLCVRQWKMRRLPWCWLLLRPEPGLLLKSLPLLMQQHCRWHKLLYHSRPKRGSGINWPRKQQSSRGQWQLKRLQMRHKQGSKQSSRQQQSWKQQMLLSRGQEKMWRLRCKLQPMKLSHVKLQRAWRRWH